MRRANGVRDPPRLNPRAPVPPATTTARTMLCIPACDAYSRSIICRGIRRTRAKQRGRHIFIISQPKTKTLNSRRLYTAAVLKLPGRVAFARDRVRFHSSFLFLSAAPPPSAARGESVAAALQLALQFFARFRAPDREPPERQRAVTSGRRNNKLINV